MEAQNEAELTEAVMFARNQNAGMFVLGGGSNLLVADKGFSGVVIRVANRGIREHTDGAYTEIGRAHV